MNPSFPAEGDIEHVVALAEKAGRVVLSLYAEADPRVEYKHDWSPLTRADLAANDVIVEGLREWHPEIPILSEESRWSFDPARPPRRYWAVDPLDGTKEFLKRNGEFTVNIALIEAGRPVLGVVSAPAHRLSYAGLPGAGARRRRGSGPWEPIRTAPWPGDGPCRVVASRSHPAPELDRLLRHLPAHELVEMGSSLKFCAVAEGSAHLYPRLGPTRIWDTAAAQAVVEAASGSVVALDGRPLAYANPSRPFNPFFLVLCNQDLVETLALP